MRLKSAIWVSAYIRRCHLEGAFAVVRRRGAEEAGAIFVKVSKLDGTAALFAPAPQSEFDEARPGDRRFAPVVPGFVADADIEKRLERELKFDPDFWIVEVEDRAGRHFLDVAG
ncbi:MAG TPA: DUF1491 family protein [Xanthobacteraceae bacterium]|nr:DUF1491 family protein [Xanthobacteraceae bacterium]